jgi:Ca2+-binding EF-hand superfamily protein
MTDEEIMEMIQAGDLDKDGMINEDEFLRCTARLAKPTAS